MAESLSPQEERFVDTRRVGRLATADATGRPFAVPICFVRIGRCFYTAVDEKPKSGQPLRRLRNIEANPRAAIIFDRYDEAWERLAWVLVRGSAALVTSTEEKAGAIAALRRKYPQYRSMALEPLPAIRLVPEHVASWGALDSTAQGRGRD